jgi:oxygen-independent coproporphyrinogen-3 oxidase
LTVEKKTALGHAVQKGQVVLPPDEDFAAQYHGLIRKLAAADIHQYELSNFARPGFEARHNSAYWTGSAYLGIGPSAHSFDGKVRHWNHANNAKYLAALAEPGLPVAARETLSPQDRLNEYLMTGLRTVRGIDLLHIQQTWGLQLDRVEEKALLEFEREGWVAWSGTQLRLTTQGFLVSDHILANLFQID